MPLKHSPWTTQGRRSIDQASSKSLGNARGAMPLECHEWTGLKKTHIHACMEVGILNGRLHVKNIDDALKRPSACAQDTMRTPVTK